MRIDLKNGDSQNLRALVKGQDKPDPEYVKGIAKEIDTLLRRLKGTRATKISKMSDGNYCIRIEKFNPIEKISIENNGRVTFTVNAQKYEGKLKSTASFPEELIAVIHSVKQGA